MEAEEGRMKMEEAGKHTHLHLQISSVVHTGPAEGAWTWAVSLSVGILEGSLDEVFCGERLALEHKAFYCENGCRA